jgi:hypothetical protein
MALKKIPECWNGTPGSKTKTQKKQFNAVILEFRN